MQEQETEKIKTVSAKGEAELSIKKLTPEQAQLVTEYMEKDGCKRLEYCIRRTLKRNFTLDEIEDYISESFLYLIKAARNYSPDFGMAFSSFVYLNVSNGMKSFEERNRIRRLDTVPIDEDVTKENRICYRVWQTNDIHETDGDILKDEILGKLDRFTRQVVTYIMDGYTITAIKGKLKCTSAEIEYAKKRLTSYDVIRKTNEWLQRDRQSE